ncbi:MAG: hypothetical protein HYT87_11015 [Nitrospirae bacterium]|nr:hypothetical protein [Nitrospirota bacterium]
MLDALKRAWALWKTLAEKIGHFNARVVLTLIYLLIILPTGLLYRLVSDPLRLKSKSSNWIPKQPPATAPDYRRQF